MDNIEPVLPGEYDGITAAEVPEPEESATYHWVEDSTEPPPSGAAAGEKYCVSVVHGSSSPLKPADSHRKLNSDPNRADVSTARKAVLIHCAPAAEKAVSAERAAAAERPASADRVASAITNPQSSQQSAKAMYSKVDSQEDDQMPKVESVVKRDPQQPTRDVAPGVFV